MSEEQNRRYRDSVAEYVDAYNDIMDHRLTRPTLGDIPKPHITGRVVHRSAWPAPDYSSVEERILSHFAVVPPSISEPVPLPPRERLYGLRPRVRKDVYDSALWTGRVHTWELIGALLVRSGPEDRLGERRFALGVFKDLARFDRTWTLALGWKRV